MFFSKDIFNGFLWARGSLECFTQKWLESNLYLWPMMTEPTDETVIPEYLGATQQDFNLPSSSAAPSPLFLQTLAASFSSAGRLFSNVECIPAGESLWPRSQWTHPLAWWESTRRASVCGTDVSSTIPNSAFSVWCLQINHSSIWKKRYPFTKLMPPRTDMFYKCTTLCQMPKILHNPPSGMTTSLQGVPFLEVSTSGVTDFNFFNYWKVSTVCK